MMKWKARTETTNIGVLELGNLTLNDAEDEFMEVWSGSITIDLSEYANELKIAIINVLVERFFTEGGKNNA